MKIVMSGVGEVGFHLSEKLIHQGHELTLIEVDEARAAMLDERLDAAIVRGSGCSIAVLEEAGVKSADLFLALTDQDEINLVACSLAKALGTKQVIARCHGRLQEENRHFAYAKHFGIDRFFSPERLAAARLAKEIRSPITPVLEQFARGAIEVMQVSPPDHSKAIGKSLKDLRLPSNVRVGLIERGSEVLVPDAEVKLEAGDQVILIGDPRALKAAVIAIGGERRKSKLKIVIYGAGEIGLGVLEYFSEFETDIKLIEPDSELCRRVSERFPWVRVVQGQATNAQTLREENLMEADIFAAATRDDEDNVMSCLQAAKFGVNPVLLTIHRPDYAGVLDDLGDVLGVHAVVSPRLVAEEELLRYVSQEPYLRLWHLNGQAEIIRVEMSQERAKIYGHKLKEIGWPKDSLILGIERADETLVATGEDEIIRDDSLLIITLTAGRDKLLSFLKSEK